jgi:hypothetical protein
MSSVSTSDRTLRILDIGGTVEYWERVGIDFLRQLKARVKIVNINPAEISHQSYAGVLETGQANGCAMPEFTDQEFDLVHSNSVIEHVETWSNMKAFASEVRRLGKNYYVQTPYFWFPIDPHFYRMPLFHWLPRPSRAMLLQRFPLAHSGRIKSLDEAFEVVDSARLLDRRQFAFLFPEASIEFERIGGLPKSMVGIFRST